MVVGAQDVEKRIIDVSKGENEKVKKLALRGWTGGQQEAGPPLTQGCSAPPPSKTGAARCLFSPRPQPSQQ